jgi:hypothetical protein
LWSLSRMTPTRYAPTVLRILSSVRNPTEAAVFHLLE